MGSREAEKVNLEPLTISGAMVDEDGADEVPGSAECGAGSVFHSR